MEHILRGARTVSKHLVTLHVPIAVLAICATAGPHTIRCTPVHKMSYDVRSTRRLKISMCCVLVGTCMTILLLHFFFQGAIRRHRPGLLLLPERARMLPGDFLSKFFCNLKIWDKALRKKSHCYTFFFVGQFLPSHFSPTNFGINDFFFFSPSILIARTQMTFKLADLKRFSFLFSFFFFFFFRYTSTVPT